MKCPLAIFVIWKEPNWLAIQTNLALDDIAVLPDTGFQQVFKGV